MSSSYSSHLVVLATVCLCKHYKIHVFHEQGMHLILCGSDRGFQLELYKNYAKVLFCIISSVKSICLIFVFPSYCVIGITFELDCILTTNVSP